MDDLVAWYREQLDQDERVARIAMGGPWRLHYIRQDLSWQLNGTTGTKGIARIPDSGVNEPTLRHIVRWDPERVLAEVNAKRRMLDYLVALEDKALDGNWWNLDTDEPIKLLALPYADRPGYREDWRP